MQTKVREFGKCPHAYARRKPPSLFISALLGLMLCASTASAQQEQADVLPVDEAVKIALANNRALKIASLNVGVQNLKLAADKTKRLPSFDTYLLASQLLTPVNYTVPAGQFGTFPPPIGPIPATSNSITTGAHPTALVTLSASQPLLTLHKINLHVYGQKLSVDEADQQLREQRLSLIDQVRQAYYKTLQIEDQIDSINASVKQYTELDRITLEYVSEKVALESENLEVKSRLADEQLKLLKAQDKLETAKESLNDLMARDLETPFRTVALSTVSASEESLDVARTTALQNNPQISEAEIDVKKATNARDLAKSQYIPDLNLAINYSSPFGYNFVPQNVASAGIEFRWEPWDWGRRKDNVNEKNVNIEQSKLKLDSTRSQVLINVGDSFRSLQEARAAVIVAQAKQRASREKLREVTLQYQEKTTLLRDVLQQQAAVDSADSDYANAVSSFWSAQATFQKAIGEE